MKILVTTDDERVKVHVYPVADPTSPDDSPAESWFIAQCLDGKCNWNSFVDEGSIHPSEGDAINDAEYHLEHDHEKVS